MQADIKVECFHKGGIMEKTSLNLPLNEEKINKLKVGESVLISGTIYTARDAAHKRMIDSLKKNKNLPFDLKGQIIYYVGPAPARENKVIGPAGPTTSYRMDSFTPKLLKAGLKGMIGKGNRDQKVIQAMKEEGAIYFAATGGAAALISKSIKKSEIIAYPDLGSEAIRKLEVKEMPVTVAIDINGNNIYNRSD
jgi:fumarate hydratase subunit beta